MFIGKDIRGGTWWQAWIALFTTWIRTRRLSRLARELALGILPELKDDVLRKVANCSSSELSSYASVRAAQLIHPRVDAVLKRDAIDALSGNDLVVLASSQAAKLALEACPRHGRKPAA